MTGRQELVLRTYLDDVERAHGDLTRLDRVSGDGDFGDNLRAGMRLVDRRVRDNPGEDALQCAADVFLDEVGGTSGPLFGLLFSALAAVSAERPEDPRAAWTRGVPEGLASIQRVGEAEPGDRTLVDALAPAASAVEQGLSRAAAAAAEGALATARLQARRGRASYVGERGLGSPDPGAVGVAGLLLAAARTLEPDEAADLPTLGQLVAADVAGS